MRVSKSVDSEQVEPYIYIYIYISANIGAGQYYYQAKTRYRSISGRALRMRSSTIYHFERHIESIYSYSRTPHIYSIVYAAQNGSKRKKKPQPTDFEVAFREKAQPKIKMRNQEQLKTVVLVRLHLLSSRMYVYHRESDVSGKPDSFSDMHIQFFFVGLLSMARRLSARAQLPRTHFKPVHAF